jgi:alkyldihydroxyacetonephosphate synthase
VLRLSDETDTALNLARPGELGSGSGGGCLAIVGYEGSRHGVESRAAGAAAVLREAGGRLEPGAGEAWERERFQGPYLRDALLDAGVLVLIPPARLEHPHSPA